MLFFQWRSEHLNNCSFTIYIKSMTRKRASRQFYFYKNYVLKELKPTSRFPCALLLFS